MALLTELAEQDATGEIAEIFREIRETCGVPYVSSMQRHLATRPGCLEWVWAMIGPAMRDGTIPEMAWELAGDVDVAPLPRLSRPALRLLGVDAEGEQAIRRTCETFIRVSPINLLFGGTLRRLLQGETPGDRTTPRGAWTPPPPLPQGPPLVKFEDCPPDLEAVLYQFARDMAGQRFVPGLYRMLGHWPAYLAHVATQLGPLFTEPSCNQACLALGDRIDSAAPEILKDLGTPDTALAPPDSETAATVVDAILHYRGTSPEMVVFSTLIRDALPDPA